MAAMSFSKKAEPKHENEIYIFDDLYLLAGLHYDNHSEFGDHWIPRVSAVYSLLDNLRLKASYGKGFRAPSISELFLTSLRRSFNNKTYVKRIWIFILLWKGAPQVSESNSGTLG